METVDEFTPLRQTLAEFGIQEICYASPWEAFLLPPTEDATASINRVNEMLFASLHHARRVLAEWKDDYNHARPHSGLGGLTPAEAAAKAATQAGLGHAPALLAITAHFGHQNHTGLHP